MNTLTTTVTVYQTEYDLSGVKNFAIFLNNVQSVLKLCHWYADNYQSHLIIGDLYSKLDINFDKLMEEIIGCVKKQKISFEVKAPQLDLENLNLHNCQSNQKIKEMCDILDVLENTLYDLSFNSFIDISRSGINNTKEDILSNINTARYLLDMV